MASVNFTLEEARLSSIPVGTVSFFYGSTEPEGWVIADGRAIPTKYPKLRSLFGNNMPDWRGRFFRMIGGNAAGLGVLQAMEIQKHKHIVYHGNHVASPSGYIDADGQGATTQFTEYTTETGGVETRPINVALNVIVYGGGVLVLYLKQLLGGVVKYGNY